MSISHGLYDSMKAFPGRGRVGDNPTVKTPGSLNIFYSENIVCSTRPLTASTAILRIALLADLLKDLPLLLLRLVRPRVERRRVFLLLFLAMMSLQGLWWAFLRGIGLFPYVVGVVAQKCKTCTECNTLEH